MKYLLAFHIGPVQEFIATARRTQDFWIGSWLLSHLSYTAIQTAKTQDANLVLPAEPMNRADPNFDLMVADTPNHFLMRLDCDAPDEIARKIENAVQDEWHRIGQVVKNGFFVDVQTVLWNRQIQNFLEIYWAIVEDDQTPQTRNRAQAALDARKRLRDFLPTQGESHQKCTLTGSLQEVSGKATVGEAREWWKQIANRYKGRLRIPEDGSERLCSISAIKRVALAARALTVAGLNSNDGHFPSTSSIATATFKEHLIQTNATNEKLEAFLEKLNGLGFSDSDRIDKNCLAGLARQADNESPQLRALHDKLLRFDGDLFYIETFEEKRFRKEFPYIVGRLVKHGAQELGVTQDEFVEVMPEYVKEKLGDVITSLRALVQAVDVKLSKYFVALKMDGDHMGAFFGKASETQAQELSNRVSIFARLEAKKIVERNLGRLVYAGGDDALVILPLEKALSCARELQAGFKKAVEGLEKPSGVEHLPTPSIGIAIAHHTAPLDGILLAMNQAESSAKNNYGRDAVCFYVLKRSGEENHVGAHWKYESAYAIDSIELMNRLIEAFKNKVLAMKFAQSVASEARGLAGSSTPYEARLAALKRLAKRHCGQGKQDEAVSIATDLAKWAECKSRTDKKPLGIEEIARWVLLARFISSGGRDEQ